MTKLYKVLAETTNYGHGSDVLNLKTGDIFEGDTNGNTAFVFTTLDKKVPNFSANMTSGYVSVPLSTVEETVLPEPPAGCNYDANYKVVCPSASGMSDSKKWMWVVGLTLAAWGLLYYSQKQK